MTCSTTTTPAGAHRRTLLAAAIAVAIASSVVVAPPAAAAPEGSPQVAPAPSGLHELVDAHTGGVHDGSAWDPEDDLLTFVPSLVLSADGVCGPEVGISYHAEVKKGPDRPSVPSIEWMHVESGGVGAVPGLSGFLPRANGTYGLFANVHYPAHDDLGPMNLTSDVVEVTVDCPEPDPDVPSGTGEPEDPSDVDGEDQEDDIVPATPTFTG